jgi:hypothetical protein
MATGKEEILYGRREEHVVQFLHNGLLIGDKPFRGTKGFWGTWKVLSAAVLGGSAMTIVVS